LVTTQKSASRERAAIMLEMALSVVLLPAPLPPSRATHPALGTASVMPFTARMTLL